MVIGHSIFLSGPLKKLSTFAYQFGRQLSVSTQRSFSPVLSLSGQSVNVLDRFFPTEISAKRLEYLFLLAQSEANFGRWPTKSKQTVSSDFEVYLIDPLSAELNLKHRDVLRLLEYVCFIDDDLLIKCGPDQSSVDPSQCRLELLYPGRVHAHLYEPIANVGVKHPERLLSSCPPLLLASFTLSEPTSNAQTDRVTVLVRALNTLTELLPRMDLISLLNRYPAVLLRKSSDLSEMHAYLTELMGLQSLEMVRASQMRAHRHSLRHSSGLRLVRCPAWCLDLEQVCARHQLAVLAGSWPPRPSSGEKNSNLDSVLAGLLTCSPSKIPLYLSRLASIQASDMAADEQAFGPFTVTDIEAFLNMYSKLRRQEDRLPSSDQWITTYEFVDEAGDVLEPEDCCVMEAE